MFHPTRDNLLTFVAPLIIILAAFTSLTFLSFGDWSPVWRFVLIAVAAHVPYALCLIGLARKPIVSPLAVVGVALLLRLILVPGMPVFSDDVYRYSWDGIVTVNGINPFSHTPADQTLEHLRNDDWEKINNKGLRTIYPPGAQYVFAAVSAVSPSIYFFKLVAALADMGVVILILLLSGVRTRATQQHMGIWAASAYGLNPLACIETGMSGHLEPLAILPLLVALYLWQRKKESITDRLGAVLSSFFLALAATIKLLPAIVLLPLARHRKIMWIAVPIFAALIYLPFIEEKQNLVETLDSFGRRWEGNGGLFTLIKNSIYTIIGWLSSASGPDDLVHLPFMDGPTRALQSTFFSLHKDGGFDPSRPGAFGRLDLALALTKIITTGTLALTVFVALKKRLDPVGFCLLVFGALVVLTPVLHTWYLLWVLPFAALRRAWPWFVFGAFVPLANLALDGWWAKGEWDLPGWVRIVEWSALLIAGLAWCRIRRSGQCSKPDVIV